MRPAMLQVNHSHHSPAADQRHREQCFVAVFREFMKELKARILCCLFRNRHWLPVLSDPARDPLAQAQLQTAHNLGVRILGSAQDEFIALQNINQAGIALHQYGCKIDNARVKTCGIRPPWPDGRQSRAAHQRVSSQQT